MNQLSLKTMFPHTFQIPSVNQKPDLYNCKKRIILIENCVWGTHAFPEKKKMLILCEILLLPFEALIKVDIG